MLRKSTLRTVHLRTDLYINLNLYDCTNIFHEVIVYNKRHFVWNLNLSSQVNYKLNT